MNRESLEAIDIFYDSVGNAFDADRALKAFSTATDDSGFVLANVNAPGGSNSTVDNRNGFWFHNAPPLPVGIFGEQLHTGEDITLQFFNNLQVQTPTFLSHLVPGRNPRDHMMFQMLSKPWGIHSETISVLNRGERGGAFCVALRHPGQAEFDDDALISIEMLNGHLSRAMLLQKRIDQFESEISRAVDTLDLIDMGLVLYDHLGAPAFVNEFARLLMGEKDGLELGPQGIIIQDRQTNRRFQEILQMLNSDNIPAKMRAGETLSVPRPSGREAYGLAAVPLRGYGKHGMADVNLAVFLFDPSMQGDRAIKLFASSFGLTRSEAELTLMLAQGVSIDEYATIKGISRNTAKWHLRAVFGKTKTSRQHELVSLVLHAIAGPSAK